VRAGGQTGRAGTGEARARGRAAVGGTRLGRWARGRLQLAAARERRTGSGGAARAERPGVGPGASGAGRASAREAGAQALERTEASDGGPRRGAGGRARRAPS
jgi:hypothetical protein